MRGTPFDPDCRPSADRGNIRSSQGGPRALPAEQRRDVAADRPHQGPEPDVAAHDAEVGPCAVRGGDVGVARGEQLPGNVEVLLQELDRPVAVARRRLERAERAARLRLRGEVARRGCGREAALEVRGGRGVVALVAPRGRQRGGRAALALDVPELAEERLGLLERRDGRLRLSGRDLGPAEGEARGGLAPGVAGVAGRGARARRASTAGAPAASSASARAV